MDLSPLPRRLATSRWFSLLVVGAVLTAWLWFLRGQFTAVQSYQWQIKPLAYLPAIGFGIAYFVGLAVCWALLLQNASRHSIHISTSAAVRVWLFSMITRYVPGNVWHLLSRVAMADKLGVSKTVVLSSATIEQVLTLLSATVCFGISLPFWPIFPSAHASLLVVIPIGLLLLHPRLMGQALKWCAKRLNRPELAWDYAYGDVLILLGAYCVCWIFAGSALVGLLWGLDVLQVDHIIQIIGAATLAWLIGFLSFLTPSGLGVREAVLVTVLATLYPLPVAIVASILHRIVLTLAEVLALAAVRAADYYTNKGRRQDGRSEA